MSKKRQPSHARRARVKKKRVFSIALSRDSKTGRLPDTSYIPWFSDTRHFGGVLTLGSWAMLPRPIVP